MMNLKLTFILFFIVFVVYTTRNVQARPDVVNSLLQHLGFKSSKLLTPEEGCGISYKPTISKARIFKGTNAKPRQFPWMALLLFKGSDKKIKRTLCGGTLITSQHILTAAHCAEKEPYAVRLGEYNRTDSKDGKHQDINVKKVILHEDFVVIELKQGRYPIHDIAILKLEHDVDFTKTDNIRPICLPLNDGIGNQDFVGSIGTVAGWGDLKVNGTDSNILQQKQLSVVDGSKCSRRYESKFFGNTELCGMTTDQHVGTCHGDSGGPLMLPINNFVYQIGIISYGAPCDDRESPEVFTSIPYYMKWIKSKLK